MVSRSSEASEGPRPLTPSRTPGTPMKPRLARVSTSPTKRDEKPKEDKVLKSSAKDVAELKDYVCLAQRVVSCREPGYWEELLTKGFSPIAIGRLPGERRLRIGLSSVELEYRGDCCSETNQVDGSSKDRIARDHGTVGIRFFSYVTRC
jgi:hypothetical protein